MGGPSVQNDADSDKMPKDAKVNFIVPSLRTTKGDSDFINPGVIIDFLNKYIKNAGPGAIAFKTYEVCVDGKKINNSKRGDQAKMDLFGNKGPPTKKENDLQQEAEIQMIKDLIAFYENTD